MNSDIFSRQASMVTGIACYISGSVSTERLLVRFLSNSILIMHVCMYLCMYECRLVIRWFQLLFAFVILKWQPLCIASSLSIPTLFDMSVPGTALKQGWSCILERPHQLQIRSAHEPGTPDLCSHVVFTLLYSAFDNPLRRQGLVQSLHETSVC